MIKMTDALPGVVFQYCLYPDGRHEFLFVSQGVKELFGFSSEQLKKNFNLAWNQITPDEVPAIKEDIRRSTQSGTLIHREVKIKNKEGGDKWLMSRGMPEPMKADGCIIWNGFLIDITEAKALQERSLNAQKLDTLGQLAGSIAHDFNNLLTIINGYAEMRIRKLSIGDEMRADIAEILKAAKRAEELTGHLLAFSRRQFFRPKVIILTDLIPDIDNTLRRLVPADIQVSFVFALDSWPVKVDPQSFHQVIINLVVNAGQAMMSKGGKLVVQTKNVVLNTGDAKQTVEIPPGDYVLLAVSDTGTGMSDEVKSHLFEPFFTTKEKGNGKGLGLSTIYGLVKQCGGYIQVCSALGHGTTFEIYLPRARTQTQVGAAAEN